MIELVFFTALILVFHAYFGYPVSLALLGRIRKREVSRAAITPNVTMIVTVHNEEARLSKKLQNTLELRYPKDKLQVIVASDGSTDRTDDIVRTYQDRGIRLLALPKRSGKENAQKEAVRIASGDILVFSDVATMLEPEGIGRIVSNFADPSVGCVSSEDRLLGKDGKPSGEGFYVRYEMWMRRLESRANTLVGLSGSFFAARKEVCRDFSERMQSDFRTLLNSVKLGLRGVSDPEAIGYYQDISDERREFDRKVRTVLRGFTVFFSHPEFLNVFRYGLFSYQYFCHKLLRWTAPVFLCVLFASNLLLAFGSSLFLFLFAGQLAFYGLAVWGMVRNTPVTTVLMKVPMYFLTVNISILVAWWRYFKGERVVMWNPSRR